MTNKHKWVDVIVAWANGEEIQFKNIVDADDKWCDYNKRRTLLPYESSPNFECTGIVWRVKPKEQLIKIEGRIKELAEEAGFVFWGNESWRPDGAIIDWSSIYDKEFAKYTELLIKEIIKIVEPSTHHQTFPNNYLGGEDGLELLESITNLIEKTFGVKK